MFKGIILPALKTVWRKKSLWLISVLTITPLTLVNEWKLMVNTLSAVIYPFDHFIILINALKDIAPDGLSFSAFFATIATQPTASLSFILSIVIIVVVLVFFAWIISNAQGLLIISSSQKNKNKTQKLSELLNKTSEYWKSILTMNIILYVIRILLIVLLIITGIGTFGTRLEIIFWILAIIAISALFFLSFTSRIGILEIIFKNKTVYEALGIGSKNAKKYFWKCMELSLVIFLMTLIFVTVFVSIISLVLSEEILNQTIINVLLLEQGFITFIGGILFLMVTLLISGIVLLFEYSAWVHWYELSEDKPKTLVRRLFNRFKKT